MPGTRLRAVLGIVGIRIRHDRVRTVLAVLGVTVAVLSTTLLGSVGIGVVETGQQKFDAADRDLWITGGPTRIAPGTLGGFEGGIRDAHDLSEAISGRDAVDSANPLLFQTVYVGSTPEDLQTVVAVGVPSTGGVELTAGEGFDESGFYNDGQYNGTKSQSIVLGTQLEATRDYRVGESVYVGGTVRDARHTTYTVTGTTPTFTQFLGTPTVALPLAELQAMTGNQLTDRASLVTVDVAADASTSAVRQRLAARYPALSIRTNAEQLRAIVGSRLLVVAAGVTLVALAVLSGLVLTTNLLALLVVQERDVLAALEAMGVSRWLATGLVVAQGLAYAVVGCLLGFLLTPPLAWLLNHVTASVVGFEGLVQVTPAVFIAGGAIALLAGVLSAAVAGWRTMRISPLEALAR